jgi:hydroxyacylglutathione hydrolase
MSLEIVQLPCRVDNYAVLLHDPLTKETACIDTPDGAVIAAALDARGWRLTHILTTHHHPDHVAGHELLKARFGCTVYAPLAEVARIPVVDQALRDGTMLRFGGRDVMAIATPGHTLGHICYYFAADGLLFAGDTLFAMGCGRLFEGTAQQMWASLRKITDLPPQTAVYCGHEYTLSNGQFALTIEPDNADLVARMARVQALREAGLPTLPTSIGLELLTNPFVRADQKSVKAALGMGGQADCEVFAEIRERKNRA